MMTERTAPLSASLKYVALSMLGAALLFAFTQRVGLYGGTVFLALIIFVKYHQSHWRAFGPWGGVANVLTAARAFLLLALVATNDTVPAYAFLVIGIAVLVLDGLDGYYARKYNTVSTFGDVFDKEVDALFVLTFGVLIVSRQLAGLWVLLPGLLRYGYVLGLSFLKRPPSPTAGSFRRQFVGMWLMGTLLAPFVLPPVIYVPGLLFATVTTTLSFGIDFYRTVVKQPAEVEA